MALTPKQQRFVEEYVVDFNGSAAYKRAGYTCSTDVVARAEACKLLANPNIAALIDAVRAEHARDANVRANDVIVGYKHIAFNDLRDIFVNVDGGLRVRPVSEWPESVGKALAGIKVKQTMEPRADGTLEPMEIIEFRLNSKTAALKDLAQHCGLLGKDGEGGVKKTIILNVKTVVVGQEEPAPLGHIKVIAVGTERAEEPGNPGIATTAGVPEQ